MIAYGRSDLSARLGIHLQLDHPRFKAVVRRIADACNKHGKLARGSAETEAQIGEYYQLGTDEKFTVVFDAIRQLMAPPEPKKKRPIGFTAIIEKYTRPLWWRQKRLRPQLRAWVGISLSDYRE